MKIKSVGIKRFRSYENPIRVEFEDLCVLVGPNDVGKSTVLEALDIFFNDGKGSVKLDKDDVNKTCLARDETEIEIDVEFSELPEKIVIDSTHETNLKNEYLLTSRGTLQIIKRYPNSGKERVFIKALHPANPNCQDLLLKKNPELKKLLEEQELNCTDKTKNAELRKAIWAGQSDLQLQDLEIEVAKIDSKDIWERLKSYMPLYTLFQSDRKNTDSDDEVQDPMRIAVKEILGDQAIQEKLTSVAETVKNRLNQVATNTLDKLKELNPAIASSLNPQLPDAGSLKWGDVFKSVTIKVDDDISINKKGSGVKRLVLFSFFRAEAERRRRDANLPSVVYAIEEPETSQHPQHHRDLTDALIELSKNANTQVLMTTHSPEIVKRLEFKNLLLVSDNKSGTGLNKISNVVEHELPYPSLNEVNFVAFNEATSEYHNELYGFIDAMCWMPDYSSGRPNRSYVELKNGEAKQPKNIDSTKYIRHQIHHPENHHNPRYEHDELVESIQAMREFINTKKLSVS